MLRPRHFIIAFMLTLLLPGAAAADNMISLGWQHTGPASGFSLKIPIDDFLAVQPMLTLSLQDRGDGLGGHATYGVRGFLNLPVLGPFHPYVGAGIGRSDRLEGGQSQAIQGYQAFLGAEYDLGHLRPSLEVALGRLDKPGGAMYVGTMFNFGLHYSF
ncbi:MAG: hypothetical protein ACM3X6_14140 [Patescibacteria group bacterium]